MAAVVFACAVAGLPTPHIAGPKVSRAAIAVWSVPVLGPATPFIYNGCRPPYNVGTCRSQLFEAAASSRRVLPGACFRLGWLHIGRMHR